MTRLHKQRLGGVVFAFSLAALGAPPPALAQEAPNDLEEVRITGSRITQTSGMTTPTPVTAVTAVELQQMSPGNVVDALSQLPQFSGNIGSEQIIGGQNSGGANVNLRGAGVNRTLVLLDGRRMVSSNRFGTVDVNMIPEALLRGIETVTGGASASYGTDAVAGVVNFLLDTDFEGVKAHLQGGQTSRSDGRNYEASLAFGHGFSDKLKVVGSFGIDEIEAIDSFESLRSRPYFNQTSRVTNPDLNGPSEIIRRYVAPTNYSYGGLTIENDPLYAAQLNRLEFLPDGTVRKLPFSGVGSMTGGCLCQATPTQTYGVDKDTEVAPGYRRSNAFLHLNYDLNDNANVYLQGLHGTTRNSDRRESISLLSVWQGRIYAENPYLPASVRQTMETILPANRRYVGFGFFGLDTPESPIGDSRQVTDNKLTAATLGFQSELTGSFLKGFRLEGYVQFGRNRQDFLTQNGIRVDRLPMALDAVLDANGRVVCRVSLPQFDPRGLFRDCVPVNLFGGVQNLTPQAVDWIRDDGKTARQEVKQHVAELVMNGTLWEGFGAGPIAGAFGASYRKDELDQRTLHPSDEFPALPDGTLLSDLGIHPATLRGVVPEGQSGGVPGYNGIPGLRFVPAGYLGDSNSSSVLFSSLRAIAGEYDVKEAFTEFHIPLLKDVPAAKTLELSTAARWAYYAGSGSIWAWKLGASWAINDEIRFRATQSRDVRAATLQERFDQTRGGVNVQDPSNSNATVTTASFSGGNPNVAPEEADTTTVGVIFQPSFLDGFSMSVDWYNIDISDAIAQLTAQNVVDLCFRGDASMCQFVHRRDDLPNGLIERVDNLFLNLTNHRISGVDLETTYSRSFELFGVGPESVTWRFYGTYLGKNSIAGDERAGQVGGGIAGAGGLPKYRVTSNVTYRNGPLSVFLQGRWIDGGKLDRNRVESTTRILNSIDDNSVPSTFYTDLNLGYTTGKEDNLNLSFTVTNLFDRAPVSTPQSIGRAGTTEFNTSLYDVIGRRYVLGVNYQLWLRLNASGVQAGATLAPLRRP
jgi:outer membrane receptor protein involved in Fe transport